MSCREMSESMTPNAKGSLLNTTGAARVRAVVLLRAHVFTAASVLCVARLFGATREQQQHERERHQPREGVSQCQTPLRDPGSDTHTRQNRPAGPTTNTQPVACGDSYPCLSLFAFFLQIQTRLQNLGSNLQNKSSDIEVLAVSSTLHRNGPFNRDVSVCGF